MDWFDTDNEVPGNQPRNAARAHPLNAAKLVAQRQTFWKQHPGAVVWQPPVAPQITYQWHQQPSHSGATHANPVHRFQATDWGQARYSNDGHIPFERSVVAALMVLIAVVPASLLIACNDWPAAMLGVLLLPLFAGTACSLMREWRGEVGNPSLLNTITSFL